MARSTILIYLKLYPKEISARYTNPYCRQSWGLVAWNDGCSVLRLKMLIIPCSQILRWLPQHCPLHWGMLKNYFSWQGKGGCKANSIFYKKSGGGLGSAKSLSCSLVWQVYKGKALMYFDNILFFISVKISVCSGRSFLFTGRAWIGYYWGGADVSGKGGYNPTLSYSNTVGSKRQRCNSFETAGC